MRCQHTDLLAKDNGYNLLVKDQDETGSRRLRIRKAMRQTVTEGRRLLPTVDPGYSHSKLLRFPQVTFTSGGSFKACFCDATLLAAGVPCSEPKHFGVEVGEVQASGISCLLTDRKYARKTCVEMDMNRHGCSDQPFLSTSGGGVTCNAAYLGTWCSGVQGEHGPGWDMTWGTLKDYTNELAGAPSGETAWDTCCVCGGGDRDGRTALRCYDGEAPDTRAPRYPDDFPDVEPLDLTAPGMEGMTTYCMLHPEECNQ